MYVWRIDGTIQDKQGEGGDVTVFATTAREGTVPDAGRALSLAIPGAKWVRISGMRKTEKQIPQAWRHGAEDDALWLAMFFEPEWIAGRLDKLTGMRALRQDATETRTDDPSTPAPSVEPDASCDAESRRREDLPGQGILPVVEPLPEADPLPVDRETARRRRNGMRTTSDDCK